MSRSSPLLHRSVLYVPAANEKALAKASFLPADRLIIDLEDAVAPAAKAGARDAARRYFATLPDDSPRPILRINALAGEWGADDLELAKACRPGGILLPKVDTPRDILDLDDQLDETDTPRRIRIWAMIETPRAMLNIGAIAALGRDRAARLQGLIAGTNDLAKDTGIELTADRRYLMPALSHIVIAARAGGLLAIDGVCNDFKDIERFSAECSEGRNMGFDGKTLIHPAQIEPANRMYSPTPEQVAEAQSVVSAFAADPSANVLQIEGRMVERLHLAQAERLLARAAEAQSRDGSET